MIITWCQAVIDVHDNKANLSTCLQAESSIARQVPEAVASTCEILSKNTASAIDASYDCMYHGS